MPDADIRFPVRTATKTRPNVQPQIGHDLKYREIWISEVETVRLLGPSGGNVVHMGYAELGLKGEALYTNLLVNLIKQVSWGLIVLLYDLSYILQC